MVSQTDTFSTSIATYNECIELPYFPEIRPNWKIIPNLSFGAKINIRFSLIFGELQYQTQYCCAWSQAHLFKPDLFPASPSRIVAIKLNKKPR